jgi:hypothetical protein
MTAYAVNLSYDLANAYDPLSLKPACQLIRQGWDSNINMLEQIE